MYSSPAKHSPVLNSETRHVALNAAGQGGGHSVALCFELPTPAMQGQPPPRTMTLIPAPGPDGLIRGVDGRTWRMPDPHSVVARFSRPKAITENHAGKLAAPKGKPAPAFAWIEKLRVEAGAIVGDIEWTPRGQAALAGRDYRYFSPEFLFDEQTGEVSAVDGGSILNDPNLVELAALNHPQSPPEHTPMLEIRKALGLTDAADETACVAAITAMKAEKQTALNAAQHPDPTQFVPAAQHQVALNAQQALQAELNSIKTRQQEAEVTTAVEGALAAGKIVPATRDYYLAMCRNEGGLDQFKKFLDAAPVIAPPTNTDKKPGSETTGAHGLTAQQLAICSAGGLDPKAYADSLKSLAL